MRTIFDLDENEYEDYENNPEKYEDVTDASIDDALRMIYDERDDD